MIKNSKKKLLLSSVPLLLLFLLIVAIYLGMVRKKINLYDLDVVKGKVVVPKNSHNKIFRISGEFYFTPNQFYSLKNTTKDTYGKLPGGFIDTELKSKFGYGSYGLEISGLVPNCIYALKIEHILSSCSVNINSIDMVSQGQPGKSLKTTLPGKKHSKVVFKSKPDGTANLILNIANFRNRKSGFASPILIGEAEKIEALLKSELIFSGITAATIFSVAMFFFLLSFFYKQASFLIWFSLASTAIAIRGIFFYPHLALIVFPQISWHLSFIIRYITVPLPIILFTIFIKKSLKICYKIPYLIIVFVSIFYAFSTIVLPPKTSAEILIYYQLFAVVAIIYSIIVIIIALIKKKELAIWIFAGISILLLFGIYDLLISFDLIPGKFFISAGATISVLLISIMVLNQYANAIKTIRKLTLEQHIIYQSFERFIPEKFVELLDKMSIMGVNLGDSTELKLPILSIDIRSFTAASEKLDPSQVFNLLNKYYAAIVPMIKRHNGVITKYLGDGLFALFPDGADAALLCALKIQSLLMENKISIENSLPIRVGIGIDYGDLLLGTVGDKYRMDSIIVSSSYYVAGILQEATKRYASNVIISDRVFGVLKDPTRYYIRPIQLIKTFAEEKNFLFEVYDCEDNKSKYFKYKTQGFMERGVQAFFDHKVQQAKGFFNEVLKINPDDSIAKYYLTILSKVKLDHL